MHDPHALAEAETYLVHVLETSTPPRDAAAFNLTAAATDFHETTGSWDLRQAGPDAVEELLARHAR
ncbi:hypothetical protein E7744_07460 [Citricoccus sp. SGAir0253]|uniref:hypothetical protein n=1 Tax=Citricoccus sp. SGAir0253 TaxID=2567881 RepID=UPI0010CD523C|nr:hypothetical protein [Citricoccus sp. SGAir0253]QCU78040.1 hypothetical protein E7744_07460 [Citricoccus sp. SGAir0253]